MESPVWIPNGSKFSVIQLAKASRTTSYSTSFQPFMDLSTRTCGEVANALLHKATNSSSLSAKPEPNPPKA